MNRKRKQKTPPVNTLAGWSAIIEEQGQKDDVKAARGRIAKNAALDRARDEIVAAAIKFIRSRTWPSPPKGKTTEEEALERAVNELEKIVDV